MSNVRLIARLDIKGKNLIKTVQLEGLRVVGDPADAAQRYYNEGIDEIIYMDIVASLYGRNHLSELIEKTAQNVFVPMTVGGGIRSVEDIRKLLRAGADKVAINTAAIACPDLIKDAAETFGSQCIVLSIEAKKQDNGNWQAYTDNGREWSHMDVAEWAIRGQELGAGEILLTSIDREGTRKGFDIELVQCVRSAVSIPVIASGGMGEASHLVDVVKKTDVTAVAMADILHFSRSSLVEIRQEISAKGVQVRGMNG